MWLILATSEGRPRRQSPPAAVLLLPGGVEFIELLVCLVSDF